MIAPPVRYLALAEVLELHRQLDSQWGGAAGLRDVGVLEGALAQPRQTYGGEELYPTLADKAVALGFASFGITLSSMATSGWAMRRSKCSSC